MRRHLFELLRVLEPIAAVRRIDALQIEIPTSLTRCLSITLDLPALAFIARDRYVSIPFRALLRLTASVVGFALRAICAILVLRRLEVGAHLVICEIRDLAHVHGIRGLDSAAQRCESGRS